MLAEILEEMLARLLSIQKIENILNLLMIIILCC
jgi:hypothetical protein